MSTLSVKKRTSSIHPKKFGLWLGLGSIIMMFAGLTSAFIVRHAQGNWTAYKLPDLFWISTVVIILSSLTLIIGERAIKKENRLLYKRMIGLTFLLGIGFAVLQYYGWLALSSIGIILQGNDPSGAFLYVISGIHVLHVVGGLIFLAGFYLKTFKKVDAAEQLIEDMKPEKFLGIELLSTYWHFVGVLWLYLFFFFQYYQ
ncbi:MAG: heme-copper oxidase subunit III [Chitinophagales bacterium]